MSRALRAVYTYHKARESLLGGLCFLFSEARWDQAIGQPVLLQARKQMQQKKMVHLTLHFTVILISPLSITHRI